MKLRDGNVFTGVCLSPGVGLCPGGGVSIQESLCPSMGFLSGWGSLSRGFLFWGPLSRGFCLGGLSRGLLSLEVSIQGFLSWGLCPGGFWGLGGSLSWGSHLLLLSSLGKTDLALKITQKR